MPTLVFAQGGEASPEEHDPLETLSQLSLEELLEVDIDVTVASRKAETLRETSSVVSVITQEDIRRAHARDLLDVLAMVPGFVPTWDIGTASFVTRGLYGFEGRTLVMIDGMALSELSFGTFPLAHNIPVHLIERVEIIRGPGAVLYGGAAELSVVSIVTRRGADLAGGDAAVRAGVYTSGSFARSDLGMAYGRSVGGVEFSVLGFASRALLSDGTYQNLGLTPELQHTSDTAGVRSAGATLRMTLLEDTQVRAMVHTYRANEVPPPSEDVSMLPVRAFVTGYRTETNFLTVGGVLEHVLRIGEHVRIVPGARYHLSHPWESLEPGGSAPRFSSVRTHRLGPTLRAILTASDLELTLGGELFWDVASVVRVRGADPQVGLRKSLRDDASESITVRNSAVYADARYALLGTLNSGRRLNAYAGVRYDHSELYGDNLAPRGALTLVLDAFHAKLMYSSAFRAPLMANTAFSEFGLDPDKPWRSPVGPERARTFELESGYVFFGRVSLVTNAFYQEVEDIIEYRYNVDADDVYSDNGGKLGTYGGEGEVRVQTGPYHGAGNLSLVWPQFFADPDNPYAYAARPRGGDTYIAPDVDAEGRARFDVLLAVPTWRIYTSHALRFLKDFEVQGSAWVVGPRRTTSGLGASRRLDTQLILSLGLRYEDAFRQKGLDLALAAHDVLSERLNLAVPFYDSRREALPYGGREISLSLFYAY